MKKKDDPASFVAEEVDIGISVADASAIKATVLHAAREGIVEPSQVAELADGMIEAFRLVDSAAFRRSEMEAEMLKKQEEARRSLTSGIP